MGAKRVTEVSNPPPSQAERDIAAVNVEIGQEQIEAIQRQREFQEQLFGLAEPGIGVAGIEQDILANLFTPEEISQFTRERFDRARRQEQSQDQLLQTQLGIINRGGLASPEQQELIRQQAAEAQGLARGDIQESLRQNLRIVGEELAPSLGLRGTDTPILDRGQRLAEQAITQEAQAGRAIRAAELGAQLNAGTQVAGLASQQQQFAESARNFQEQLRQQAFQNRLGLVSEAARFGLGLSGIGNAPGSLQAIQAPRLAQTTTSQTSRPGGLEIGLGVLGALSGAATAAGQMQQQQPAPPPQNPNAPFLNNPSSKSFKDTKRPIDEDEVLDMVEDLDVERWRYIGDDKDHIGPHRAVCRGCPREVRRRRLKDDPHDGRDGHQSRGHQGARQKGGAARVRHRDD
jgi:hypothetical protein